MLHFDVVELSHAHSSQGENGKATGIFKQETHAALKSSSEPDPAMVKARESLGRMKRSLSQEAAENGVPQNIFLKYIKSELDNERNCLELPLTFLILMSFSVIAIYLLRQDQVFAVEESLEFDIVENANFAWAHAFGHKGIFDVNSIADFWSWTRLGYLPLIVQPVWYYSEGYTEALGPAAGLEPPPSKWQFEGYEEQAPVKNDYLRLNRMIGGIRISQEVADKTDVGECRFPTTVDRARMEAWLGKPCTPSELGLLTPERVETEVFDRFTRTQWLLPELDSLEELNRLLLDMEDGCAHSTGGSSSATCRCIWCREQQPHQPWLDEQTRRVELSFIVYNPHYGLYSYVGTNFFYNRAGYVHKLINVMSVWQGAVGSSLAEALPVYIAGTLWIGSVLYVCVNEVKEIFGVIRSAKRRWCTAIREEYLSPWNIVDWVSICVGITAFSLFIRMRLAVMAGNEELANMITASLELTDDRPAYLAATESFFLAVEAMCMKEKEFRVCLYIYPNIMMMRLFKSFAAQPRLAIVTATLQRASVDLLHFGIVFAAVYLCMMVNSILFFGQDLENFSNFGRAFHSCFLAMFGDWDWDALKEIGYFKAQVWFWMFLVINILILLNMLLAIIMDAYTAEKLKAGSAETLWTQTWQMRRRRLEFKRKERVRLNDIWDAFLQEGNGDEKAILSNARLISSEFLLNTVPRIQAKQANRLLVKSLEFERKLETADITEEDIKEEIKQNIGRVHRRCDNITEDVRTIAQVLNHYDCMEACGDPEYEMHFGRDADRAAGKSQESVQHAVTALSSEIGGVLADGLMEIESWQEKFEKEQSEMHGVITELQNMVTQQADCFGLISETLTQLNILSDHGHKGQNAQ